MLSLCWILLLIFSSSLPASTLEIGVSPLQPCNDEQITLDLTVYQDTNEDVSFTPLTDANTLILPDTLHWVSWHEQVIEKTADYSVRRGQLVVQATKAGISKLQLPTLPLTRAGQSIPGLTPAVVYLQIKQQSSPFVSQIVDMKEAKPKSTAKMWLLIGGGLTLTGLVFVGWLWDLRRQRQFLPVPAAFIPYLQQLQQQLQYCRNLPADCHQQRPVIIGLSQLLRDTLQTDYGVATHGKTTAEILTACRSLDPALQEVLAVFLSQAEICQFQPPDTPIGEEELNRCTQALSQILAVLTVPSSSVQMDKPAD